MLLHIPKHTWDFVRQCDFVCPVFFIHSVFIKSIDKHSKLNVQHTVDGLS